MNSYGVTPADVQETRLSLVEMRQLLTQPNSPPPDDTAVNAACQKAIDESFSDIHVAAGVYYAIPIVARADANEDEAAALLVSLRGRGMDMAAYKMMQHKPAILNAGDRALYWSQLKKSNDEWLRRLQSGDDKVRITLPSALERVAAVTSSGGAWAESEDNDYAFEKLRGWM